MVEDMDKNCDSNLLVEGLKDLDAKTSAICTNRNKWMRERF